MSRATFMSTIDDLEHSANNLQNELNACKKHTQDLLDIEPQNASCLLISSHLEEIESRMKEIRVVCSGVHKDLRKRRTTHSMRYLSQWEKIVEDQHAGGEEKDQLGLFPKPIIKKRMKQFERAQKKRVSSTVEAFLDRRGESVVLQDVVDEDESQGEEEEEKDKGKGSMDVVDIGKETEKISTKPRIVDVVYKMQIPTEEYV